MLKKKVEKKSSFKRKLKNKLSVLRQTKSFIRFKQFFAKVLDFTINIVKVSLASVCIFGVLLLLNKEITWINFFAAYALYFFIEEAKVILFKVIRLSRKR